MSRGYAVVGCGYFGAELATILAQMPDVKIVSLVDATNADALAARLDGALVVPDPATAATMPGVDAVIVASPNWAHPEGVHAAARAGKAVFCEKPIALNYADCQAMVDATRQAGVLFMAGHVMHFMPGVREVKRRITAGEIGDVVYIHTARNGWEDKQPSVSWKKKRELSGGHLYHHIHELDLVQSILGTPTAVTMSGGNVAHSGAGYGDEDDLLLALLDYSDRKNALLEYGSAFRYPEHYVLIQGSEGWARIDLQDTKVEVHGRRGYAKFLLGGTPEEDAERTAIYSGSSTDGAVMYGDPTKRPPLWLRRIMAAELAYFDHLVAGGEPQAEFAALSDGSAAAASIATADALTLSLNQDRKVTVAEVTSHAVTKAVS